MTEKEFTLALKYIMNIDFSEYDNGKKDYEEYRSGKTFYHARVYIKYYGEKQKCMVFVIDADKVEELKSRVKDINETISGLTKTVDAPNYHPHFAYFVRAYWNVGYELYISRRNRLEEEAEIANRDEEDYYIPSATHGDYSPSCPWNAPGMSVRDFI